MRAENKGDFHEKLFEYAKRVSVGTWVRGVLSLVSIVNMALAAFGKTPLNIEYGELYTAISLIFAAAVGFASYWKNNSFTSAAIEADKFLHEQRIAEEKMITAILYNLMNLTGLYLALIFL